MGRHERLEHLGEALRRASRPNALNAYAGTFAEQEQFVGQKVGTAQPRLATEIDDFVAVKWLDFLDYASRGMVVVRQFDGGIGNGRAALAGPDLVFGNDPQPGQKMSPRISGVGPLDLRPGAFQLPT